MNIDNTNMKKIILVISIVFIIPFMSVYAQSTNKVNWNTNLDYAKKLAESNKQPLVIFFMEEPAGTLSTSVFDITLSNKILVDKINGNFVAALVKGDPVLQREYSVQITPTLLVVDNKGAEIDRLAGVIAINDAFSMLENAQINFDNSMASEIAPGGSSTSGAGDLATGSNADNQASYKYKGSGTFVRKKDGTWEHRTSFYVTEYTERSDDNRYYYLSTKDKKVNVAVPKRTNAAIWLWDEESSQWVAAERITVIEQNIGE